MQVTSSFCGRRVPHQVVVRALELLEHEVGLDSAIAEAEGALKLEREERREQLVAKISANPDTVDQIMSSRRSGTDDLLRERKALGILSVISRVAEYLPEDQDMIHELMDRAAKENQRG